MMVILSFVFYFDQRFTEGFVEISVTQVVEYTPIRRVTPRVKNQKLDNYVPYEKSR